MLPEIPETLQPYMELAQAVLFALIIFLLGWIASKWGDRVVYRNLRRADVDEALARFVGSITRYLLLAATVIASLQTVGIETTSLSVVLGSAGLAIGLALQGSLSNFASGVMILFFKPIRLDDWVQVDGVTGKVRDIGLFVTTLWDVTNNTYIVPNSSVLGGTITNYSMEGVRRESVAIGVAYGTDLKVAVAALKKAAARADKVVSDPAPGVACVGFGASSVDFLVHIYMQPDDYYAALDSARHAIYEELDAAGVEIPFDQIVLHKAPE